MGESSINRDADVKDQPGQHTGTKSELNFPLSGSVTLMAYSQRLAIGIAKPRSSGRREEAKGGDSGWVPNW